MAEPWWDLARGEVRLGHFARVQGGAGTDEQFATAKRLLAGPALFKMPLDPAGIQRNVEDLLRRLYAETAEQATLELAMDAPEVKRVVPASQGLVTVLGFRGRAVLNVK